MNPLQIPSVLLPFHKGWDELIRSDLSISRLFAFLVLPLSLLPPAMIYYAGGNYGDVFDAGVSPRQWHIAAGIFFVAELLTVMVMAWLIHFVCRANDVRADFRECYALAAIAPIPMWLSSLILFVPSLAACVVVGGLGLVCSLAMFYRGVFALFRVHEDVRALEMAAVLTGTGLLAWLLLIQVVLIH